MPRLHAKISLLAVLQQVSKNGAVAARWHPDRQLPESDYEDVVSEPGRFLIFITVQANAFRHHKVKSSRGVSGHGGHSDAAYPYAHEAHRMIVITIDQPVDGPRHSFQRLYTTADGSFYAAPKLQADLEACAGASNVCVV